MCTDIGVVCVKPVHSQLDLLTVPSLREQLAGPVASRHVVVDMADVVFCDCRGIGVLVAAQARQQAGGGSLHLVSVNAFIAKLLALCGIDRLLLGPPYPTANPAVRPRGMVKGPRDDRWDPGPWCS
jgi:anti-anti-sigma factor